MSITIGEVARRSGVPTKTIRYYESVGLLAPPERGDNGYRYYEDEAVTTLRFVRHARELGFPLDDVRALLGLWADKERPSREVKQLALRRIAEIDQRVAELERLRDELSHLVEACHGDHRPDCPILDALDESVPPVESDRE